MGIKQLYNDNLRKLPNKYGNFSVMPGYYHFKEVCPGELKKFLSVCGHSQYLTGQGDETKMNNAAIVLC